MRTIDDVLAGRARWCVVRKANWAGTCLCCGCGFSRYARPCRPKPMYCSTACRNKHVSERPEVIEAKAVAHRGDKSNWWKGDAIAVRSGRSRALRAFPDAVPCESCGAAKSERHHKDGNTKNNQLDNIARLCRRCHMKADGRIEQVRKQMAEIQPKGVKARWNKS